MPKVKSWINATRPRTLPLALSGILMGAGLAWFYGAFDYTVTIFAFITATLFQILSNFANDYGDSIKGTDNKYRLGPTRTVQSGEITKKEMEKGMMVVAGLILISGFLLTYKGTWHSSKSAFFLFIAFGFISLFAAYFYTAGKKSYGYSGFGDLFVFVFFGLLQVAGLFYLNAGFLPGKIFLPAITIGFFSAGVLNLNNMRDIANDRNSGKITIPVRIGKQNSRIYHLILVLGGWVLSAIFVVLVRKSLWQWVFLLSLPVFLVDLRRINRIKNEKMLDPFLKRLSLSTLLFTLLFCIGFIISAA